MTCRIPKSSRVPGRRMVGEGGCTCRCRVQIARRRQRHTPENQGKKEGAAPEGYQAKCSRISCHVVSFSYLLQIIRCARTDERGPRCKCRYDNHKSTRLLSLSGLRIRPDYAAGCAGPCRSIRTMRWRKPGAGSGRPENWPSCPTNHAVPSWPTCGYPGSSPPMERPTRWMPGFVRRPGPCR
jgi:hypothetical protein